MLYSHNLIPKNSSRGFTHKERSGSRKGSKVSATPKASVTWRAKVLGSRKGSVDLQNDTKGIVNNVSKHDYDIKKNTASTSKNSSRIGNPTSHCSKPSKRQIRNKCTQALSLFMNSTSKK